MPDMQLPLFEGQRVEHLEFALSGKAAGASHNEERPKWGEEMAFLVIGHINKIEHGDTDAGLLRTEKVKIAEVHELEPGEAAVLLTEARKADAEALDRLLGRSQLPFDPDTGEVG